MDSRNRDAGQEGTKEWIKKAAEEIEKSNHPNIWSEKAIARYAEVIARHVPVSAPVPERTNERRIRQLEKALTMAAEFCSKTPGWDKARNMQSAIEEALAAPVPEPEDKWAGCKCLQDEHYRDCPAIKTGKCHYQSLYIASPWERPIAAQTRKDELGTCECEIGCNVEWSPHVEMPGCVNWKSVAPQASPEAPAKEDWITEMADSWIADCNAKNWGLDDVSRAVRLCAEALKKEAGRAE